MSEDAPDVTAEDALAVAQRALAKVNELEALEDDLDAIQEELVEHRLRLEELDDRSYDQQTLDEKIGRVREYAYRRAAETTGAHRMTYKDVMWDAFDGEPSADHCYKLMRLAGDATGFEYAEPADGPKQLRVHADEVRTHRLELSSANNGRSGGGVL